MHVYVRYNKEAFNLSQLMYVLSQHIPDLTLELVDVNESLSHYNFVCTTGLPPHCLTINVIDSFKAYQNTRATVLGNYEDVYVPFTSLPIRNAGSDDCGVLHQDISQELLLSMIAAPILKLAFMRWDAYGPC